MLGLLVLLLAAAAVCVRLGAWQLDRASVRGEEQAEAEHQAVLDQDVRPLEDVLTPQTTFHADQLGVPVEVTGEYRADQQVYVTGRSVDGQDAVLVVTALWVNQGPHAGAMIPVLRGWIDPGDVDIAGDEAEPAGQETARVLEVPDGEQRVTGWLRDSEQAQPAGTADNVVGSISSAELAGLWGGPTWSGYLVEFTEEPGGARADVSPTGLRHAPPPGQAESTGLNLQNLAYAVEWVVFGGFALALWGRMLRDDVRGRREDAELARPDGADHGVAEHEASGEPARGR